MVAFPAWFCPLFLVLLASNNLLWCTEWHIPTVMAELCSKFSAAVLTLGSLEWVGRQPGMEAHAFYNPGTQKAEGGELL